MSSRRPLIGSSAGKEMSTTQVILPQGRTRATTAFQDARRSRGQGNTVSEARSGSALALAELLVGNSVRAVGKTVLTVREDALLEPAGSASEAVVAPRGMAEDEASEPADDQAGQGDRDNGAHAHDLVGEPRTLLRGVRRVAGRERHRVPRLG